MQVAEAVAVEVKNFLKVGLSSIIVQVSNQESETRYAATDKNIKQLETFYLFKNNSFLLASMNLLSIPRNSAAVITFLFSLFASIRTDCILFL